jgi:hypothetical protein
LRERRRGSDVFSARLFPSLPKHFETESSMANTERDMPAANRSASEIDFVLRRAKWRRGPDVTRDLARAQRDAEAKAEEASARAKPARKSPRRP